MVQTNCKHKKLLIRTETHLVGQDSVDAVLTQADHPIQTFQLIISESSYCKEKMSNDQNRNEQKLMPFTITACIDLSPPE